MTSKPSIDAVRWRSVVDGLTKALMQYKEAAKVEPAERIILSYQSIDNTISALLILRNRETRDHGAKVQRFGEEFVTKGFFSKDKAKKLKPSLELWGQTRFSASKGSIEAADEVHQLAKDVIDFAIDWTASELDRPPAQILADINENAKIYQATIVGLLPEAVPGEIDFDAFDFVQRFRSEYGKRGLVEGHEMGFMSGCTHIQTVGLPKYDGLGKFEQAMFADVLSRLSDAFNDMYELRVHIAQRTTTAGRDVPTELLWTLTFNFLVHNLWYAIEDDVGLPGILRLLSKWDKVIGVVRDIGTGATWSQKLRPRRRDFLDREENAKAEAKRWLAEHIDYLGRGEARDPMQILETFSSPDKENERLAAIITISPRAMDDYGDRIENRLREFWRDSKGIEYSSDKVRSILEAEAVGRDIVGDQKKQGIGIMDVCFGLSEFAYRLRRRGITSEEENRLQNWDWFKSRAGDHGLERLKKYIEEERKKESDLEDQVRERSTQTSDISTKE